MMRCLLKMKGRGVKMQFCAMAYSKAGGETSSVSIPFIYTIKIN